MLLAFNSMNTLQCRRGFLVFSKVGQKLDHVLKVAFSFNGFVHIIAAALEFVSAGSVLNDFSLLHALHQAVINTERHTTAVGKLGQDSLFLSGGWIFSDNPHRSVTVANSIWWSDKNFTVPGKIISKVASS